MKTHITTVNDLAPNKITVFYNETYHESTGWERDGEFGERRTRIAMIHFDTIGELEEYLKNDDNPSKYRIFQLGQQFNFELKVQVSLTQR